MHELPILRNVLEVALEFADKNQAVRITKVNLAIGDMREFVEGISQKYWDYISAGTLGEGAVVSITRIPAKYLCLACGEIQEFDWRNTEELRCSTCSSADVELTSGREIIISNIEIREGEIT